MGRPRYAVVCAGPQYHHVCLVASQRRRAGTGLHGIHKVRDIDVKQPTGGVWDRTNHEGNPSTPSKSHLGVFSERVDGTGLAHGTPEGCRRRHGSTSLQMQRCPDAYAMRRMAPCRGRRGYLPRLPHLPCDDRSRGRTVDAPWIPSQHGKEAILLLQHTLANHTWLWGQRQVFFRRSASGAAGRGQRLMRCGHMPKHPSKNAG